MAPQREIDETTAGGQLAAFLVALTKNTPVRELAETFGRSSSSWGNYLNGSQLIPKQLVGRLVESFTPVGPTRQTRAVHALQLWQAAAAERRAGRDPADGAGLVRQHQRRDDALQQVIKYQALAANAEKHLAELRPMLAYTQSRLENAELQLKLGDERERARRERQLGQARERLGRVQVQQERARSRRMTAEEQQEFWMAEVLAAQEEIRRLEHEAQDDLDITPPATLEPVGQDAAAADTDDADFDARLEFITVEGLQDQALIEEDLQDANDHDDVDQLDVHVQAAVQDPVQPLSKNGLDKATTSDDAAGAPLAGPVAARRELVHRLVARDPTVQIVPADRLLLYTDGVAEARALDRSLSNLSKTPGATRNTHWAEAAEAAARQRPAVRRHRCVRRLIAWFVPEPESQTELGFRRRPAAEPRPRPERDASDFVFLALGIIALILMTGFAYWSAERVAMDQLAKDHTISGAVFAATLLCLPMLYACLRACRAPRRAARIAALLLHATWSILLILDQLPWPPPGAGTK
ncbi:hypothetical protein [Streptomyces sp. NPDC093225]|uniref:hypothetical protein n=1 Tax=Streptomyces sp. NPDC093225 TaxID=3366034 RepID=UPI003824F59F